MWLSMLQPCICPWSALYLDCNPGPCEEAGQFPGVAVISLAWLQSSVPVCSMQKLMFW